MEQIIYNIKYSRIDIIERTSILAPIQEDEIFNFDIRAEAGVDVGSNLLTILVTIIIKTVDKRVLGKITVAHSFEIPNLNEVAPYADDNERKIPQDLDRILRTESISTTRGLLFSELRGTYLHKALLPIIPPDSLKPIPKEEGKNEKLPK